MYGLVYKDIRIEDRQLNIKTDKMPKCIDIKDNFFKRLLYICEGFLFIYSLIS